jgi:hypothetical protein
MKESETLWVLRLLTYKPFMNSTVMEPCIAKCVFYITNQIQLIQCSLLLSALTCFGRVSAYHQERIKQQESITIPKAAHTVL